ncbi:Uncharacterised protein [Legionella donaldsonii]|uniref:Uncharacterized protein n=1 Tax=Legionella donaldsonii TaxID=45060 RepID=A0A378J122_9GAMM|nr:hypothetical protein [Legionella donaldsonii]STX41442.1 Uncharacterised protein [Legionella donaldsonii]
MTSEELVLIGEKLFGNWGWQTKLAKALRVDASTVRRWVSGHSTIPGPVEVALELLLKEKERFKKLEKIDMV